MQIKKDKKINVSIKEAYIDGGNLIDVETGEIVNLNDVISKVYGETEVKIAITATSSEEIDLPESGDSEE